MSEQHRNGHAQQIQSRFAEDRLTALYDDVGDQRTVARLTRSPSTTAQRSTRSCGPRRGRRRAVTLRSSHQRQPARASRSTRRSPTTSPRLIAHCGIPDSSLRVIASCGPSRPSSVREMSRWRRVTRPIAGLRNVEGQVKGCIEHLTCSRANRRRIVLADDITVSADQDCPGQRYSW